MPQASSSLPNACAIKSHHVEVNRLSLEPKREGIIVPEAKQRINASNTWVTSHTTVTRAHAPSPILSIGNHNTKYSIVGPLINVSMWLACPAAVSHQTN